MLHQLRPSEFGSLVGACRMPQRAARDRSEVRSGLFGRILYGAARGYENVPRYASTDRAGRHPGPALGRSAVALGGRPLTFPYEKGTPDVDYGRAQDRAPERIRAKVR